MQDQAHDKNMRPAPRRVLREALALARDALLSTSENFRYDVQDVVEKISGSSAAVDMDDIDGASAIARLADLWRAVADLRSNRLDPCVSCGALLSPAEGTSTIVDGEVGDGGRMVTTHDDLPHCALLELHRAVRALATARPLDDDQDPALDTVEQRLVRAHQRFSAIAGDGDDARAAAISCDACEAVGYGNASCWSCVSHWGWMPPEQRRELVARLVGVDPQRPLGTRVTP